MHHLDRLDWTLFGDNQSDQRPNIELTGKFQAIIGTVIELDALMDVPHPDSRTLGVLSVEAEDGGQFLFIHPHPVRTSMTTAPGFLLNTLISI